MTSPSSLAGLSPQAQALGALVPAVYLARDADRTDRPLARLLEVLAAPLAELEEAIDRLAADHFIERASPEVLPLLADLVGARLLGTDPRTNRGVIAATVRWRRDAGTLRTLEDMLTTTTGWPTEADEAYRSLLATQDLDDLLLHRGRTSAVVDPVVLADPLSRPAATLPRLPGEGGGGPAELARLGAADALRPPVSARTLDLDGWVRPERVLVRTTRLAVREVDRQEVVHLRTVQYRPNPAAAPVDRYVGVVLDPRGEHRDRAGFPVPYPLAGSRHAAEPALADVWTQLREPDPEPLQGAFEGSFAGSLAGGTAGSDTGMELVTPTELAADPVRAERSDLLTLFADGVVVAGAEPPLPFPRPLAYRPPGALPVLRLADVGRPSPGEEWHLDLAAVDAPGAVGNTLADPAAPVAEAVGAVNPAVLRVTLAAGPGAPARVTAAGSVPRGADLALRVARGAASGYVRAADRSWAALAALVRRGHPLSGAVALDAGGDVLLARLERRPGGGTDVALLRPDAPAPAWQVVAVDLPGLAGDRIGDTGDDGPLLAAAGVADALLLAGPVTPAGLGEPAMLGLWRVTGLPAGAPAVERLDLPGGPAPRARTEAATVVAGGRLWLHGGREGALGAPGIGAQRSGAQGSDAQGIEAQGVRADLWSIAVDGAAPREWTRHRARHAPARTGARLLAVGGDLVLVGGADEPGTLARSVHRLDPSAARPDWTALPDLPVPDGPGTLWARVVAGAVEVVVWGDRTRPATSRLELGAPAWTPPVPDGGEAPNPPAEGDAVVVGDRLIVPGPVPLPPSEVLLSVGPDAHLAFLPALDPADGAVDVLLLDADGSSRTWLPDGVTARPSLRLGAGREEPPGGRRAPALRIGVPGRLRWRPFALRQVNLAAWERPLVPDLDDVIAVDPRLGRLAVRQDAIGTSRLSVSYRTGRGAALGAGYAGPDRDLPPLWREPPDPDDPDRFTPAVSPELDPAILGGPAPVTARVDPASAGEIRDGARVVAGLAEALRGEPVRVQPVAAPARRAHIVAVDGSPRLDPATLTAVQGDVVSVFAAASGAIPHVAAEGEASLTLRERLAAGEDPGAGPTWFLTGLATDGALEVLIGAGLLDVRWCDLALPRAADPPPGAPGNPPVRLGLRVAGAAGSPQAGRTPTGGFRASRPLTVRLTGCLVGGLAVPPWVQVIAAGCTFDAGADDAVALDAAGAALRLRGCTVRGRVRAGVLEASSCVLRGGVEVDRADRGWLRHSVLDDVLGSPGRAASPVLYRCVEQRVSLASLESTSPYYLLPDENNPPGVRRAGEGGILPGAHGERSRSMVELAGRSAQAVPLGLVPHHLDRAAEALRRMNRRLA